MMRFVRPAAALLTAALFFACSGEQHMPQRYEITMGELAFSPASITVNQGDTIVFINNDIVPHTATDTLSATPWDTGPVVHGAQAVVVMQEKGVNAYFCSYHPGMMGEIRVE